MMFSYTSFHFKRYREFEISGKEQLNVELLFVSHSSLYQVLSHTDTLLTLSV